MPVWYTVTMRNDGDEIIFVIQAKKPGEGIASGDEDTVGMNNADYAAQIKLDNAQKDVHEIAVAALIAAAKDILQYESDCHGECAADSSNETCWWRKMRIAIEQIEAQVSTQVFDLQRSVAIVAERSSK
jgi:hypothetical protein